MSKKQTRIPRSGGGPGRSGQNIVVRTKPRAEPDLRRLARALIELARSELEAEAQANQNDAPAGPSKGGEESSPEEAA